MKYEYSIRWGSPYTDPPDGIRCMAEEHTDVNVCPPGIQELKETLGYGSGWFICFSWTRKEGTKWSLEAKQRVRRSRLRKRIEKKWPMFADQFFQEIIERKPDHYGNV